MQNSKAYDCLIKQLNAPVEGYSDVIQVNGIFLDGKPLNY